MIMDLKWRLSISSKYSLQYKLNPIIYKRLSSYDNGYNINLIQLYMRC